jgi:hypothetical protein
VRRIASALICLTFLAGCGGHSSANRRTADTNTQVRPISDGAVPGAPRTPKWLRLRIWSIASGLGDPHPAKIAVTLNVEQRGRTADRVWMRGHFTCDSCTWSGTMHARLAGYTFDAQTHQTVSVSLSGGP